MKKSFIMHIDSMSIFGKLSPDQARDLIFAIEDYHTSGALPEDPIIAIAFEPFLNQFIRDNQKYKKTCERNKKNISKRWKNKNTDSANHSKGELEKENTKKSDFANIFFKSKKQLHTLRSKKQL